jgi:hypothetical protein
MWQREPNEDGARPNPSGRSQRGARSSRTVTGVRGAERFERNRAAWQENGVRWRQERAQNDIRRNQ